MVYSNQVIVIRSYLIPVHIYFSGHLLILIHFYGFLRVFISPDLQVFRPVLEIPILLFVCDG